MASIAIKLTTEEQLFAAVSLLNHERRIAAIKEEWLSTYHPELHDQLEQHVADANQQYYSDVLSKFDVIFKLSESKGDNTNG